jgi:hypothetical protein
VDKHFNTKCGIRIFRRSPSSSRAAAPPDIAARELKISRETARNQLKSVFAKTDTHRQSELVALLFQVRVLAQIPKGRQLTGKYQPQTETATLPDRTACRLDRA